jgi:hypothetical protein
VVELENRSGARTLWRGAGIDLFPESRDRTQLTENISHLFSSGGASWNLPEGEGLRQAIPALRGYAYQLHHSLAAWIALPPLATLHLEAAEDYATIAGDPSTEGEVLTAVQVKDTRESGSITLNSQDVLSAIHNLWALQEKNRARDVRLTFLTSSPIGRERKNPLPSGEAGLELWRRAARGAPVTEVRNALIERVNEGNLADFLRTSDDDLLRARILAPLSWVCGAAAIDEIEADNRAALIELGHTLGGTPDMSGRALEILLAHVLSTILKSPDRRLTRADLLRRLEAMVTVRVPAQAAVGLHAGALTLRPALLDLTATGAWGPPMGINSRVARRGAGVQGLAPLLGRNGSLWIHGATGFGKTILAELVAAKSSGEWRVLHLRGASGMTAAERLTAARHAVVSTPGLVGVIIDDITPEQEPYLEDPVAHLQGALERRNAVAIFTSRNPPGQRLVRAAKIDPQAVHVATAFAREDAADLVAAYGGAPAEWAHFVWMVGGFGHPQLVDVVVAGLAARNWPLDEMQRWRDAGFKNEDVEAERGAATRRLLDELEPEALQFLSRVARIVGLFDRELALAAGRASPAIGGTPISLERLTGHWIERISPTRLRASPLIEGLDQRFLSNDELSSLDYSLSLSILERPRHEADLVDTAFAHAALAKAEDLIVTIANMIVQTEGEIRVHLASAMPVFREADPYLGGFLKQRPYVALIVRVAQHRLVAAIANATVVSISAQKLITELDSLEHGAIADTTESMVLSLVLIDDFAFGKIADWFVLVQRFDALQRQRPSVGRMLGRLAAAAGYPVMDFIFIAHAIHAPDLKSLVTLFDQLDALPSGGRARWLAAVHTEREWAGMLIDNAWLKESQLKQIGGLEEAKIFRRLAEMALSWGDATIAARCFRAEAIMLDEYARSPAEALSILDLADDILPDNLDLRRERAKIAWRRKDYRAALDQLSAIADRLEADEPLETAFSLREAAISAGELGLWHEAHSFFVRAERAAATALGFRTALRVGLAVDSAAALFQAGERFSGVRAMAKTLEELSLLDSQTDRKSRYCHLVARHVVLWMKAQAEGELTLHGKPIVYVVGAGSNPDPSSYLEQKPLTSMQPVWWMLSDAALDAGMSPDEILAWPGVSELRNFAAMDVSLRKALLDRAIGQTSVLDFHKYLIGAVEGAAYVTSREWATNPPDVLSPERATIPALSRQQLREGNTRDHLRDAVLAMAVSLLLSRTDFKAALANLRDTVCELVGDDAIPEWSDMNPRRDSDFISVAARSLRAFVDSQTPSLEELFAVHLRVLDWLTKSNYGRVIEEQFATRVREDWQAVLDHRSAFLLSPLRTSPAIRGALGGALSGRAYIANILLAATPGVRLNIAPEYRDYLQATRGIDQIAVAAE